MTVARRKRAGVLLGAVLWCAASAGATAVAAPRRAHDSREAKARAACAAGRVDEGVALLEEIAAQRDDPNALYNEARCYQQNGRNSEALERFKLYRDRVRNLPPAEAAQLDGFIRALETQVAAKAKPPAPPPSAPSAPAESAPLPLSESAPLPPAAVDVPAAASRGSGARIAAITLGAVGAVALGTGVYYTLRVKSITSDLESPTQIGDQEYQDKLKQGQHAETYQWIAYGVAAAAFAGSTVVLLVSRPGAGTEAAPVSVAPLVGRAGAAIAAGAVVQGRF